MCWFFIIIHVYLCITLVFFFDFARFIAPVPFTWTSSCWFLFRLLVLTHLYTRLYCVQLDMITLTLLWHVSLLLPSLLASWYWKVCLMYSAALVHLQRSRFLSASFHNWMNIMSVFIRIFDKPWYWQCAKHEMPLKQHPRFTYITV